MKFSSLAVRKIFILLGMLPAVVFQVVPAFANQMVSGADLKKEIHAFLATRSLWETQQFLMQDYFQIA